MITIEDWALRETIAIKDVEISQLKAEIKRLEEQLRLAQIDNNLLLQKEVALEAEVEALKCCGNCKSFHHCQFRLSDADVIVKPPENFDCDKWEDRK